jgi:hypothetical protein
MPNSLTKRNRSCPLLAIKFSVPGTSEKLRLHDQPWSRSVRPHPAEKSALNHSEMRLGNQREAVTIEDRPKQGSMLMFQ